MATKYEITIGEDIDGFLGYDQGAIAQIDIEASQAAYEAEVTKRINKLYPDLNVAFAWGGSSDYTYPMDDDPENYSDLQFHLEMIEEEVYSSQMFWVEKA